jgi:hypothetical protein
MKMILVTVGVRFALLTVNEFVVHVHIVSFWVRL